MSYSSSQSQAGRGSILALGGAISITGDTNSSTSITGVSSTVGIVVGMPISGAGIPAATTIAAIGSGTLTLSQAATATATGVALTLPGLEIGEVRSAPVDRGKWKNVDVTNFQSGSDEEILPTIRETGNVTYEFNRVSSDAGQAAVEAAYQSGALTAFTLALPMTPAQDTIGDVYSFKAYVIASDFTVDVEKEIAGKVTLTVSDGMTLAVGT